MSTATQTAMTEIKSAMAATNELFNAEVFGKRNFDALDSIYTADARILPPGAPIIAGREAIKQFWSDLITSTNAKSALLTSVDVLAAGDGVIEIGRATLSIQPDGSEATSLSVKYVVHWREEGGRWKWNLDIWNQEP
jgi:ketosteroid isomerase-like protein